MASKRTTINRPRRPTGGGEALALFVKLERTPMAWREHSPEFQEQEIELARLLGLDPPWLCGSSVLGRERSPCWPPGMPARDNWFKARAIRKQLLAAAAGDPGDAAA